MIVLIHCVSVHVAIMEFRVNVNWSRNIIIVQLHVNSVTN